MGAKKATKKSKKKGSILFDLVFALILIAGLGILLYPTFSNYWNEWRNKKLNNNYKAQVEHLKERDLTDIWKIAHEYNAQHRVNAFVDVFENEDYVLTHPYDTILDPNYTGLMGYIEIPKIRQELSIFHGTGPEALERGVGHIEGTSLPTGGPGTHCVLSGHRGLPNAKIFTDLDQIVIGDKFFLHILDEILAYQVDQIEVVTPDNADFLQIVEGEDYCTLLTCTPYGVNSHRMLVRGVRIPYVEEDVQEEAEKHEINARDRRVLILVIALVFLFVLIILMRLLIPAKKKKKKEEEPEAETTGADPQQ